MALNRESTNSATTVALYVTCLINTMKPQIAHACVRLIESLGFQVDVPLEQTCCGQPAYNNGQRRGAIAVAKHQIEVLEAYSQIVVPSGSCTGMIRNHFPRLLKEPKWQIRAQNIANKTKELSEFLTEQQWQPSRSADPGRIAHHASCSCIRETKSHLLAEQLMDRCGIQLQAFDEQEVCCGFGGTFCTKFSGIADRMASNKLDAIAQAGASKVVAADYGCLMHLQAAANEHGREIEFLHIAETLNQYV